MISFKSKITRSLLMYFFLNPTESRYLNELARNLEVDSKNLDTKLKELEKVGLFQSEFRGIQKYYFVNKSFPLLAEYKSIFQKTVGIEVELRESLKGVNALQEAYIFGSYAKDAFDVNSDLDLLVIGGHTELELQKAISKLQKRINREINVVSMTVAEFVTKKKRKDPFISEVFGGKLIKLL